MDLISLEIANRPALAAALLGALVFLSVLALERTGALQAPELIVYDTLVGLRASRAAPDSRIVLVGATEDDLNTLDWPVSDETLSRLLKSVFAGQPRTVGLDIYRDVPRPPGHERLVQEFRSHRDLVVVMKLGEGREKGVLPPPALKDSEQVGFSDVMFDPGGIVRRGLLYIDDGKTTYTSFSFRLALQFLAPLGITPQAGERDASHLKLGKLTLAPFEANDGGYVRADAAGYQFLLDFLGGPVGFPAFSFAQVLTGKVPAGAFRDKIVIVGVTAESVKDYFDTPFSGSLAADQTVYGITLHGHVASQLLRMAIDGSPPVRTSSGWQKALLLLLWCSLGALAGYKIRGHWQFAAACGAGLAILAAFGYSAFLHAWWIPVVPPSMGLLTSAALVTAFVTKMESAERRLLMQLFSRYVSRDVADEIWNRRNEFLEGGRPRPLRLTATVLFSDIRGFTSVSEKHEPQVLMDWLNTYMESMASLVVRHGGIVDKFIGDAVMAVFGVPVARGSESGIAGDAENAVTCALDMGREIERLNSLWSAEGLPAIGIRIGIYTGPLVAGSLGSRERMEYTVIGDTVNVASRLESLDKGLADPDKPGSRCRILIGDSTLRLLKGRFHAKRIGEMQLKGKDQGVTVFMVTGVAEPDRSEFGGGHET